MGRKNWNASITVFLSLVCILFLALICAATESARIEGARAQSAAITGMGTFSLLSEFEPKLLEKYGIFALDAGRSGSFQKQEVDDKLQKYLAKNANPKERLLAGVNFDPWNLSLSESKVSSYTLLTDEDGEAFYQQAISTMIHDFLPDVVDALAKLKDSDDLVSKESEMEKAQAENAQDVRDLENEIAKEQEAQAESERAAREEGIVVQEPAPVDPELEAKGQEAKGVLEMIKKLRGDKGFILSLVTWGSQVSDKSFAGKGLPSSKISNKGTLALEKKYTGWECKVAFREYLLKTFPNYTDKKSGESLNYQLEYLISGKKTDTENLRHVVLLLLAIREGANWFSVNLDSDKRSATLDMTQALCALIPVPGVSEVAGVVIGEVILMAWAFAESLLDLRILLDNGKVPLIKNTQTWKLDLDSLAQLPQIIQDGSSGNQTGLTYKDYLRILLNVRNLKQQRLRALDLIQTELRAQKGMENFKAENCIVAVEADASYVCSPVFFSLPQVIMGIAGEDQTFTQTAGLSY